mgnify:FL=1|jgi:hypothetical protein
MKFKLFKTSLATLVLSVTCFINSAAAGLILDINESGSDLVVSWSGSLDLDSAVFDATRTNVNNNGIYGSLTDIEDLLIVAGNGGSMDDYNLAPFTLIPTLDPFTGGSLSNGIIAGDHLFIDFNKDSFRQIWLTSGYQSGQFISGSNTFAGATLLSLGANVGVYNWAWANNIASDTLTLRIGQPTEEVPEPSTLAIFALGMIGLASRRFKKQS